MKDGLMFDPNLDPGVENAARKVFDACADLETIGLRVERTDPVEPMNEAIPVTDGLLFELAATEFASTELKAYAERVVRGECEWCEIERLVRPVPSEVAHLKASSSFAWTWDVSPPQAPQAPQAPSGWPAQPPDTSPELRRKSKGEQVVGPSDWPDEFESYPTGNAWR